FANPKALRLAGFPLNSILDRDIRDYFHLIKKDSIRKPLNLISKVTKSRKQINLNKDTFLITKAGEQIEVALSASRICDREGNFVGVAVVFRDITQQKFYEQELSRLASIVDSSQDAIYSTDPNWVVTTWNKGAEKLYGYTSNEVIGRTLDNLTIPRNKSVEV